jgi:hypothetical protein
MPFAFTIEELSLAESTENGEVYKAGGKPIRAEAIQRIIFGAPIAFPGQKARPAKFTNKGFQLEDATISKDLDLEDISASNGLRPPRLSFGNCRFEGEIHLMRGHFGSLSFKNSRFSVLNASDAVIDGPVDLAGVRGIDPDPPDTSTNNPDSAEANISGQCWVVLASAKIAGRINAAAARLAGPPGRSEFVRYSKHAIYALDLRATHVQASIVLRPNFVAIGGVCLDLATVDGSIWANGARFVAVEENAFAADYSNIRGSIYLRSYDFRKVGRHKESGQTQEGSIQFKSTGQVSLFAARLGGSLHMQGAQLQRTVEKGPDGTDIHESRNVLNACNAAIGGDCYLSCWYSHTGSGQLQRFYSEGDIWMDSARITNELSFSGGRFSTVTAENVEVGGNCYLSVREESKLKAWYQFECCELDIRGTSIKGNLDLRGALLKPVDKQKRAKVAADGIVVGGNCEIGCWHSTEDESKDPYRFHLEGELSINSATIKKDLLFSGAIVERVVANNIDVGGDCRFSVHSPKTTRFEGVEVEIRGAAIKGNFDISGAVLHSDQKSATFLADAITVGGSCRMSCWRSAALPPEVHPFQFDGELSINSAIIKKDLIFSGAVVRHINANNVEVGGDLSFSVDPKSLVRFEGNEIHVRGASIKGNFDLRGAVLGSGTRPAYLSASGIAVGGNCYLNAYKKEVASQRLVEGLRFECHGNIELTESSIINSLRMDGALIRAPRDSQKPALNLAGTTIGGEAQLMTWNEPNARTSLPFLAYGGTVVLRLTGVKIAQKLILNGARIRANPKPATAVGQSIYAINAANAQIGGKASLSTYSGMYSGARVDFRFVAFGTINFTAATITLGLDLGGALLSSGTLLSAKALLSAVTRFERNRLALDLSRAHLKFVWLYRDGLDGKIGNAFRARGSLKLEHATIDADLDLNGAILRDPVIADHIKVGTSVKLELTTISRRSVDSIIETKRFAELPEGPLKVDIEKSIRKEILNAHVERTLDPDLSLRGGEIGDALVVDRLKPRETTKRAILGGYCDLSHSTVDLRALRIGQLADDGGLGWSRELRLWLDGFRYERLQEVQLSSSPESFRVVWEIFRKRLWNPSALPRERRVTVNGREILMAPEVSALSRKEPRQPHPKIANRRFWICQQLQSGGAWERRLRWLSLQFLTPGKIEKKEYTPDAYEQLVKGFNAIGSYDDARSISSARLSLESRLHKPLLFRWIVALFRLFFNYGFSARRAVLTFALCILLGWWAVMWANSHHILVVNMGEPETRIFEQTKGTPAIWALEVENGVPKTQVRVPCDQKIHPFLYALDVFVPVLDLHQQAVCSIDPERGKWRIFQAIYAILGWILTPLTILTITGILRRHLEK